MSFKMDGNMASSDEYNFDKTLEYRIYKCSSYCSTFVPENIIIDKPLDQTSRWSTDNDNHPQYIILKLTHPSIIKKITFGKFEKAHVCNVRKFKVYGGLRIEKMMELLEGGLRNDSVPETFYLKNTIGDKEHYFPIKYLKILLLQSWGPNMYCSVWHVRLSGTDDVKLVKPSIDWLHEYQQKEVIRLCMKHFRKCQQHEIVDTLHKVTGVSLEDAHLSILYNLLVVNGDYKQAEQFISNATNTGYLDDYINSHSYQPSWKKILPPDVKPGMRGGHQMVLDSTAEILYLFGGWNGSKDLADLWAYNIKTSTWTMICKNTSEVGGPSARSCHKMCLDTDRRQIFTLGRYLDIEYRTQENLKSDFYVYNIDTNQWTLISEDTAAVGGPALIFDHQMLMDVDKRTIYVFGGRILMPIAPTEENTTSTNESIFSGLYSYHVPTGIWQKLACDISRPSIQNVPTIKSRNGHSMLFHPGCRKLYIFAGQRGKDYLNDFFTYEVDTNKVEHISLGDLGSRESSYVPAVGFTQRATIDPELGEIYVLSGLSKEKDKRDENVQNSFWVYSIKNNKWYCVYRNENVGEKYWNKMEDLEPCPRFAHQLVYDHVRKIHYLFGGNPGRSCIPKLRLDDFWQLQLRRPTRDQILAKCKLLIRKHKFEELAMHNTIEALEYLQRDISEIIDHNDIDQTREFQLLVSLLFRDRNDSKSECMLEDDDLNNLLGLASNDAMAGTIHTHRNELYDKLSELFPESLTQPRPNLIDLLPL